MNRDKDRKKEGEAGVTGDKEKIAIKERYLGQEKKKKKKRVTRQNDRKFIFDWEAGAQPAAGGGDEDSRGLQIFMFS